MVNLDVVRAVHLHGVEIFQFAVRIIGNPTVADGQIADDDVGDVHQMKLAVQNRGIAANTRTRFYQRRHHFPIRRRLQTPVRIDRARIWIIREHHAQWAKTSQ